ncbi:uncharacterized protein LOC121871144 [Homarus americanus]|uniref:uncharacterized protein LOC121871144 n=1 Tax=Homarus americanus TaxID=6706 RepID=UPI001C46D3AE|nr:uncharacterized protein LOC121871144 [Homarus americanus]
MCCWIMGRCGVKRKLGWCVVVVTLVVKMVATLGNLNDNLEGTAKEGQLHYELMTTQSKMPRYGDCYQNTLQDLRDGCSNLTDEVQSRLALAFTNCYMVRFGWVVYPCEKEEPLDACMYHLDSRAATVYSSMLSSTLAMCHFLQAQAWHQATTDAVHRYFVTSLTSVKASV